MKANAKTVEAASSVSGGGLIVFGRDGAGKAHASWFDEPEAGPARAAAAEMGFFALQVTGDGLSAISGTLPAGRLFASGRAFVPFVKGALFDQLVSHQGQRDFFGAHGLPAPWPFSWRVQISLDDPLKANC